MITSAAKIKPRLPYFIVFILVSMHVNDDLIVIRTHYFKVPFFRTARTSMFAQKASVFVSPTHNNSSSNLKGEYRIYVQLVAVKLILYSFATI